MEGFSAINGIAQDYFRSSCDILVGGYSSYIYEKWLQLICPRSKIPAICSIKFRPTCLRSFLKHSPAELSIYAPLRRFRINLCGENELKLQIFSSLALNVISAWDKYTWRDQQHHFSLLWAAQNVRFPIDMLICRPSRVCIKHYPVYLLYEQTAPPATAHNNEPDFAKNSGHFSVLS